jgi:ribosome recycling factor
MDAQTIKIEPWDKSIISNIEKWIVNSWTWLSPLNQWDYILIKVPILTKERRIELTKLINRIWEEYKIQIRNIRHDAIKSNKTLLQEKEISEDENKTFESNLDETTKDFNKKVEERIKERSENIMKF